MLGNYVIGIVLFAIGILMILLGRPRNGISRPWLRSYPVGMAYVMTTMTLLVFGVVFIIMGAT